MSSILSNPPNPSSPFYSGSTALWQKDMYDWAIKAVGKINADSQRLSRPIAPFVASAFTTNTTAVGTNSQVFTIANSIPIVVTLPVPVVMTVPTVIGGIQTGTSTITKTGTGTSTGTGTVTVTGTSTTTTTITSMADANCLATLIQDLINAGTLSPSLTRS